MNYFAFRPGAPALAEVEKRRMRAMFWDRVAWVYDVFAKGINRKGQSEDVCRGGRADLPYG